MKVLAVAGFQPREGPSRGLLCDYEPLFGPSFEALVQDELIGADPEFTNEWWDTFTCRACMSVDRQFGPELQFALQD